MLSKSRVRCGTVVMASKLRLYPCCMSSAGCSKQSGKGVSISVRLQHSVFRDCSGIFNRLLPRASAMEGSDALRTFGDRVFTKVASLVSRAHNWPGKKIPPAGGQPGQQERERTTTALNLQECLQLFETRLAVEVRPATASLRNCVLRVPVWMRRMPEYRNILDDLSRHR